MGRQHSEETKIKMRYQKSNRAVLQLTIKGRLVGEFYSISEAARQTKIGRTNISNVLKNQSGIKTAGGYIWNYESDYTAEQLEHLLFESVR
jgi:hypothetical protein